MAQELRRADPSGAVLIVGRRGGVAEELVRGDGVELQTIAMSGLDLSSLRSTAAFGARMPLAVLAARRLIRRFRADVVVGAAGYVCVPVVLAARAAGIPVVLLEQNALPGRAVRLLARRARVVATSFEETAQHLRGARVVCTGNPVRRDVLSVAPSPPGDRLGHLLVMGGSQGAHRLNDAVVQVAESMLRNDPGLLITHQSGATDAPRMAAFAAALPADVRERYRTAAFFDPVSSVLAECDQVIMRAGGSSLAECSALGRPMILVPYPHAGGHQTHNAAPYVDAGAALLLDDANCDGAHLAELVTQLTADPKRWRAMANASRRMARPGAATEVATLIQAAAATGWRVA